MANTIQSVVNYLPQVIDKVNKENLLSVDLNVPAGAVKAGLDNSSEVKIRKYSFGGLGNYTGGNIPANAGITAEWETKSLQVKRSTRMNLELIEGQEGQVALAEAVAEFQRVMAVPERDAVVFSKAYTNASAATTATPATLTAGTVKQAIDLGIKELNENEAPKAGRLLYVSCEVYDLMKNSSFFTYQLNAGEGENRLDTRVAGYDGMRVIEVPKSRFNTAVTLDATNGFTLTGTDINFLIVCPSAVQVIDKITKGEMVESRFLDSSFEDVYKYLAYYDAITWDNQETAIYAHAKA
jgi:hypothetical protein